MATLVVASVMRLAALAYPTIQTRTMFERLNEPRLLRDVEAQKLPVVRLPGFLSEHEQQQLHALADAVRASDSHSLSDSTKGAMLGEGAWGTTFINQRLPECLPDLWERAVHAMKWADAQHFHFLDAEARHALNLRSAEYHEIITTGSLPHPKHLDYGRCALPDSVAGSPLQVHARRAHRSH